MTRQTISWSHVERQVSVLNAVIFSTSSVRTTPTGGRLEGRVIATWGLGWYPVNNYRRGERINSMWPNDAIWLCRSGSTLAQVMACCLMAPSHYLNQVWLPSQDNFRENAQKNCKKFKYFFCSSARGKWVNSLWPSDANWWHRTGSALAQVMACCLTTWSHFLNQ